MALWKSVLTTRLPITAVGSSVTAIVVSVAAVGVFKWRLVAGVWTPIAAPARAVAVAGMLVPRVSVPVADFGKRVARALGVLIANAGMPVAPFGALVPAVGGAVPTPGAAVGFVRFAFGASMSAFGRRLVAVRMRPPVAIGIDVRTTAPVAAVRRRVVRHRGAVRHRRLPCDRTAIGRLRS